MGTYHPLTLQPELTRSLTPYWSYLELIVLVVSAAQQELKHIHYAALRCAALRCDVAQAQALAAQICVVTTDSASDDGCCCLRYSRGVMPL